MVQTLKNDGIIRNVLDVTLHETELQWTNNFTRRSLKLPAYIIYIQNCAQAVLYRLPPPTADVFWGVHSCLEIYDEATEIAAEDWTTKRDLAEDIVKSDVLSRLITMWQTYLIDVLDLCVDRQDFKLVEYMGKRREYQGIHTLVKHLTYNGYVADVADTQISNVY